MFDAVTTNIAHENKGDVKSSVHADLFNYTLLYILYPSLSAIITATLNSLKSYRTCK